MEYQLGVYGDSIAFGYGTGGRSWFDDLSAGFCALKAAQNGEKIVDVYHKITTDSYCCQTLILAVGLNDLLQKIPQTADLSFLPLLKCYEEILKAAKSKAERVIVQSVLPVREDLFPNQPWLDCPMQISNNDIVKFNQDLLCLCRKYDVFYLDAFTRFNSLFLPEVYFDAVHLNENGQQELCRLYKESNFS